MGAANAKQLLVASKSRVCLTDAALHKTGSEHISRSSARHVQLDRVHQKPAPVLKKGLKSCQEEAIRCHLADVCPGELDVCHRGRSEDFLPHSDNFRRPQVRNGWRGQAGDMFIFLSTYLSLFDLEK